MTKPPPLGPPGGRFHDAAVSSSREQQPAPPGNAVPRRPACSAAVFRQPVFLIVGSKLKGGSHKRRAAPYCVWRGQGCRSEWKLRMSAIMRAASTATEHLRGVDPGVALPQGSSVAKPDLKIGRSRRDYQIGVCSQSPEVRTQSHLYYIIRAEALTSPLFKKRWRFRSGEDSSSADSTLLERASAETPLRVDPSPRAGHGFTVNGPFNAFPKKSEPQPRRRRLRLLA